MLRLSTYIILCMLLVSCGASKNLPVDSQMDSVSVVIKESVIYKDSIIYVEVPVESDKAILPASDTSHLETSLAVSEAWVVDGRLNHTLSNKQDKKIAKVIAIPVYLREEKAESLSNKVLIKELEKSLNNWQSFRMTLGTIVMIIITVWLLIKLAKRFLLGV